MNQDYDRLPPLRIHEDEKPKEFNAIDGNNRKARRAQKSVARKRSKLAKAA